MEPCCRSKRDSEPSAACGKHHAGLPSARRRRNQPLPDDTEAELKLVEDKCRALGVNVALSEVWGKGGEGGIALAEEVVRLCDQPNDFTPCYTLDMSIEEKINAIAKKIYHAGSVEILPTAAKQMKKLQKLGYGNLPICMAKTQYSFSDNADLLGAPSGFKLTVRNLKVSAGAGFIVALTGEIMTMQACRRCRRPRVSMSTQPEKSPGCFKQAG